MNWLLTSYCVLNKLFYIISYKGIIYKIMWQCDAAHFLCDLNISQLSTRFKKKGTMRNDSVRLQPSNSLTSGSVGCSTLAWTQQHLKNTMNSSSCQQDSFFLGLQ